MNHQDQESQSQEFELQRENMICLLYFGDHYDSFTKKNNKNDSISLEHKTSKSEWSKNICWSQNFAKDNVFTNYYLTKYSNKTFSF